MKKVAVVGSVNIDTTLYVDVFPNEGETITGKYIEKDAGGKGLNQAIAIRKSGTPVSFLSAIGNDDASLIVEATKKYNLDAHLFKANVPTGTAYIIVDRNSNNKITVIPGSNAYINEKTIDLKTLDESDIIVLQNEIDMSTNEYIFTNYKNKTIVYNPSPLKPIRTDLFSSISYLIVNEHEVAYFGEGDDIVSQAKSILDKGVKNVVVTLGERGSILFNKDFEIRVDAIKVNAIDTVAAGDTYLGYFVHGLATELSLKESMELASKASAITVTRKGAVDAIPYIEEIK